LFDKQKNLGILITIVNRQENILEKTVIDAKRTAKTNQQ